MLSTLGRHVLECGSGSTVGKLTQWGIDAQGCEMVRVQPMPNILEWFRWSRLRTPTSLDPSRCYEWLACSGSTKHRHGSELCCRMHEAKDSRALVLVASSRHWR